MSELIRKMTALMQLEAGSEQLVIKRFDVAGLARSLLLKNRPRFQQAEARVVPPPDEPVSVSYTHLGGHPPGYGGFPDTPRPCAPSRPPLSPAVATGGSGERSGPKAGTAAKTGIPR